MGEPEPGQPPAIAKGWTAERTTESKERSRQGGFALVLSLILVVVVAGLCAGFVRLASATAGAQTGAVDQMRAFYLAEAGLAEAFHAVRMGRNGAIGSAAAPANYGDGTVWVQSARTPNLSVWLRATAVVGGGRAVLGLVIDPEEAPLGFFADEDLVIEAPLLVDGFDSNVRTYSEELAFISGTEAAGSKLKFVEDPNSVHLLAQQQANRWGNVIGHELLLSLLETQVELVDWLATDIDTYQPGDTGEGHWVVSNYPVPVESLLTIDQQAAIYDSVFGMRLAVEYGALAFKAKSSEQLAGTSVWEPDLTTDSTTSVTTDETSTSLAFEDGTTDSLQVQQLDVMVTGTVTHTGSGGMLGSNGNIIFQGDAATASTVMGSVVPGVGMDVLGLDPALVAGSTESRAVPASLAPVVIPDLGLSVDIAHDGAIPHVIPAGQQSIGTLSVASGAEVIVRGPVTLVVADLTLADGSTLTLDTRDGNVELFVTGSMAMDPASYVDTTALTSSEVSIQAGAASEGAASPTLALDATAAFRGTVYAPDSTVHVGSEFEIFGGVVARRLEIQAGARLHFDDESYSGGIPVPEQESWQILELPAPTARPRTLLAAAGLAAGPAPIPLATAHALDEVQLSIRYEDQAGVKQTYAGPESGFDWKVVDSIDAVGRTATYVKITETDGKTELDPDDDDDAWDWEMPSEDWMESMSDWFASHSGTP